MSAAAVTDLERKFLSTLTSYLVSLPYDLKVLYEAAGTPDLDRSVRELAAGTIIHVLSPHEAAADDRLALRYVDDVVLVRAAFGRVRERGGEGAAGFTARFPEFYAPLDADLALFERALGVDSYGWLVGKLDGFAKLPYKGKRAPQYLDDEEASAFLYEEGLAFQTDYEITEESLEGRIRRVAPILEALRRRRDDEAKKIS